jgi:hypothetical protein
LRSWNDSARQVFDPKEWVLVKTSSNGELSFYNQRTGEDDWYTPPGMTAEEILAIPNSGKFFKTRDQVMGYMKYMAAERAKDEAEAKKSKTAM